MRLSSTSHSPSLLPSPPPHLPPAAAAAAALRRARTPQCKDCSSITIGARQGLVFRGQMANFSDGYIVQLESLLAQASPHVSNSSSVPQLNTASAPYTPTLSLFLAHVSPGRGGVGQDDVRRYFADSARRNVHESASHRFPARAS